jgi:hypothetical protein
MNLKVEDYIHNAKIMEERDKLSKKLDLDGPDSH